MSVLYYDHTKREITLDPGPLHVDYVLSVDEARKVWNSGRVTDFNQAFMRLAANDFDMDAVEEDYRAMDA